MSLRRGERISIAYQIESTFGGPITLWLGADCWPHYNVKEDLEVSVNVGTHTFHRWLTVGDDWPGGPHKLGIGVWVGPVSNPDDSLRLAVRLPAATIQVM